MNISPHPVPFMTEFSQAAQAETYNERSLKTLTRAIVLAEGHFSLILVRCNYAILQQRMVQQLQHQLRRLHLLELPPNATSLLQALDHHQTTHSGEAVVVLGLETITDLERFFLATNSLRDQFPSRFLFPIVLWLTDTVLQKLMRYAPDFKSWSAASIRFVLSAEELISLLQQKANRLFAQELSLPAWMQVEKDNPTGGQIYPIQSELAAVQEDLQHHLRVLDPELVASLAFMRGRAALLADQLEPAMTALQESLGHWQNSQTAIAKERQGIALFYLGRCHLRSATRHPEQTLKDCQQALVYFQASQLQFEQLRRLDWVGRLLPWQCETLQRLGDWPRLFEVATNALTLHHSQGATLQLAQDYGFLAEVSLAQAQTSKDWRQAFQWAQHAMETLSDLPASQTRQAVGYSLLLLALSQKNLGSKARRSARYNLEQALQKCDCACDPLLYLRILRSLRALYFVQAEYLAAFRLKQQQREIEQQYGFRAFRGASRLQAVAPWPHNPVPRGIAQEILASGRQKDLERLLERLSRNDCKMTVIHGPSGVGKSSLIHAGLVPALMGQAIGARDVLPVVVQVYGVRAGAGLENWQMVLGKALVAEWERWRDSRNLAPSHPLPTPLSLEDIYSQLKTHSEQNFLTVLIFDQFEEFFAIYKDTQTRQKFYEFLRTCLELPFVKVIFSLREDALHYLLEPERLRYLGIVNHDILSQDIRYYLGNFSGPDAQQVIERLTARSPFFALEPPLISQLVKDLAGELGSVSPIELQVVGSQLQEAETPITTLEHYRQLGPHPPTQLVAQFLKQVVADCGPDHETLAWNVLFLMMDDQGNRPIKSRQELLWGLVDLGEGHRNFAWSTWIARGEHQTSLHSSLDLVLEIFTGSGLLSLIWQDSDPCYQLIHDYLVKQIQSQAKSHLKNRLAQSERKLKQVRKQQLQSLGIGILMTLLAGTAGQLALWSELQRQRAVTAETNAQVRALSSSSDALLASHQNLDALVTALRAGRTLSQSPTVTADTRFQVITTLQQSLDRLREKNRLEGHQDVVWGVSVSPDGGLIASASTDKTVRLWRPNGQMQETLRGHSDRVTMVEFSPKGDRLASASRDKTIKLWRRDGQLQLTLRGHHQAVNSVSFSPDGTLLASASADGTVKIWNLAQGQVVKTWNAHPGKATTVSFSPNGQQLASAGDDQSIHLWAVQTGRRLQVLKGQNGKINQISFSPDGTLLASASDDGTVKLWPRQKSGRFTAGKTLTGHQGWVFAVQFSGDGQRLASGSEDNTIRLWSREGELLQVFQGHKDGVTDLRFSPNGQTLLSSSFDKTIRLWRLQASSGRVFQGHSQGVQAVAYSPDGQLIASGSRDRTLRLWRRNGELVAVLKGHTDSVETVRFSPDSQWLVSGSRDQTLKIWSRTGQLLKTLPGHTNWVLDVAISPDGQRILSASRDHTLKLWHRSGQLIKTLVGHRDRVNAVVWSSDGQVIASASDDQTVRLWRGDGRFWRLLPGHQGWVLDVTWSPDGQTLASASYDNTIRLWSAQGELQRILKGHPDSVAQVEFTPDGSLLTTISWNHQIQFWRLDDTLLKTLQAEPPVNRSGLIPVSEHRLTSLSFSQDGKELMAGSLDRTVRRWNLDLDQLLQESCQGLQDYLRHNPKVREGDRDLCPISPHPQ